MVHAIFEGSDGSSVYRAVLLYPELGIAIRYFGKLVPKQSAPESGEICFDETAKVRMLLWDSQTAKFDWARMQNMQFIENRTYMSLEHATGVTVAQFFKQLQDNNANNCVMTPSEIWQ